MPAFSRNRVTNKPEQPGILPGQLNSQEKSSHMLTALFFMAPIHSMAGMPFPVIPIPSGRINAVTRRAGEA
jgi:hypothetical protein